MSQHLQLLEAVDHGALTLFLGADLPQTITGLPSRVDLARGLAQRHGLDVNLSLAQVAQRVGRAGNRFDFTDYLRRELDTAGKSVPAYYRGLATFAKEHSLPAIVTTAYDDLLERALRDAGVPFDRLVRGSDVAFARPDRLALIKLYGDVQMPDTLVVTEDDHYGLWRDREKENLLDEVRNLLKKQTILFLGYNLSDPDFNLLWREVLDKMGRFARTAYAVWPDLPEGEVQMWRDRMIQVLDADPWGLVGSVEISHQLQALEVPMSETPGISSQLYGRLQTTLLRCGPFRSDNALSPLFVDSRISQWRDLLPSRDNAAERVQAVIEKLSERNTAQGENALVLLLEVLRDQTSPDDACFGQLDALVRELVTLSPPQSLRG